MSQVEDPWRALASEGYSAAVELVDRRRWRSSISRAYYAAYSLVCAGLRESGMAMPADREGPSHAKLPNLVESNLTTLWAKDRPRIASRMRDLYALRVAADYWPSVELDESDVLSALHLMGDVFRWLKEKAHGKSRQ